ncbi:hypothetical protein SAMN02745154_00701 [Mycoplasmopsis verecunda]|uniref:Uncharacterized protein n=1 Tax=Mycoplasmopsis verecunda TaxID=171291 RepID=A0A1T4MFX1_9BACT|nr:hypothetical protein SAMN02745154_00701 [Mycoplasmopsis verecunda]
MDFTFKQYFFIRFQIIRSIFHGFLLSISTINPYLVNRSWNVSRWQLPLPFLPIIKSISQCPNSALSLISRGLHQKGFTHRTPTNACAAVCFLLPPFLYDFLNKSFVVNIHILEFIQLKTVFKLGCEKLKLFLMYWQVNSTPNDFLLNFFTNISVKSENFSNSFFNIKCCFHLCLKSCFLCALLALYPQKSELFLISLDNVLTLMLIILEIWFNDLRSVLKRNSIVILVS